MRKNILIILSAAFAFSCSSGNQAKINGTFVGQQDKSVYLELLSTSGRTIIDSAVINSKGDFKFKVELPTADPTFYNVKCENASIPLIVAPKETVVLNSMGSLSRNYTVSGSSSSEKVKEFNTMLNTSIAELDSISNAYANIADDEDAQNQMIADYSARYYQFKRDHIRFIVTNAVDMSAVYAIYQRLPGDAVLFNGDGDIVYYQMVADSISSRYPNSPHLRSLNEDIAQSQSTMDLNRRINESMGQEVNFPELRMPDMYGNAQSLTAVAEGKVTLVDFWTISDPKSQILNAELKELYDVQSANGFEVYQVSIDTDKSAWITAVQGQRLPWVSVCDLRGASSSSVALYNISVMPTNILINKEGDIVARNVYGQNLEDMVARLLR